MSEWQIVVVASLSAVAAAMDGTMVVVLWRLGAPLDRIVIFGGFAILNMVFLTFNVWRLAGQG